MKRRITVSDFSFHFCLMFFLTLALVLVGYPLINVIASSFSSTEAIVQGRVSLWPVEFSTKAYKAVFDYHALVVGFWNSLIYVAGGTASAVVLLLLAAYPLSRKDFYGRKIIQTFFVITMFFGGGLIPNYLLMRDLHLIGSRLSMMIAFSFSCYNMIIVKSFFQNNIPQSLLDAAHIDGCGDLKFFLIVALPLSSPVIAVMVLFNAVGIWNGYFGGLLYLTKPETFSFSMILRNILFVASMPPEIMRTMDPDAIGALQNVLQQLRYSVLVIGALPMMVLYPFIQKYFIKGIMVGSLKE